MPGGGWLAPQARGRGRDSPSSRTATNTQNWPPDGGKVAVRETQVSGVYF